MLVALGLLTLAVVTLAAVLDVPIVITVAVVVVVVAVVGEAGTGVDGIRAAERLRPRTGNRRFLGLLQAAAAWREREAQRINIPRQRLVKDETLLELPFADYLAQEATP